MSPQTAPIKVDVADLPLFKALVAEHVALHAYLAAKLLHTEDGRLYSDLLVAHDAVAYLWPENDREPMR